MNLFRIRPTVLPRSMSDRLREALCTTFALAVVAAVMAWFVFDAIVRLPG